MLAHDVDSEDFLAALVSPTRSANGVTTPGDCRAALARLSSAMEFAGGLRVESGWTIVYDFTADPRCANAVEEALERGARERERYAFFSTIGHELRTPLTSIRGYLETLIEDDGLDRVTKQHFLEVARAEALRMGRLVDGMFDVSMLDLRAGEAHGESSELRAAISSALDALAPLAATRRVCLTRVPAEDHMVAVSADRLVQLLINLIENAIKHGHEGGRVVVSATAHQQDAVEVDIDDDGPGVPVQERELVFSMARRGSNARSKGNGLGLAVVRLMLERVGGEVYVLDSPLGGARLRMRLPLCPENHGGADAVSAGELEPAS